MPLCCIGGVCIPYSALVPLLLYALKWFVQVFGHYLPESWRLQLLKWTGGGTGKTAESSTTVRVLQEQKRGDDDDDGKSATKAGGGGVGGTDFNLEREITKTSMPLIECEEDWKACLSQFHGRGGAEESTRTTRRIVAAKFTASWCKPCKALQPTYQDAANQTYARLAGAPLDVLFVQVDSDQCDEIADSYNVNMLPTTCILELVDAVTTKEIARYGGSDELKLRQFIKHNIK